MTARESVKNYPSALREMTNYSARGIKKICTEVGARPIASEQEFDAQKRMMTELEQCCDKVEIEEFKVRPASLYLSLIVLFALSIATLVMVFLDLIVPAIIMCVPVLIVLLSIILRKNIFAPFFPKKTSHNIIGIKKPAGTVSRCIIFSAYCDSTSKKNPEKGPVGANCNLSGCFAALSVVKFLQRQNLTLENTEVWIVLTGSHKANSNGVLAFAKNHKFDDVQTVFVGLDTLYDPDSITVAAGEPAVYNLVASAADTANCNITQGKASKDTEALAKSGMKTVCIGANGKNSLDAKADNADALNLNAIESCIDVALETVFLYDCQELVQ